MSLENRVHHPAQASPVYTVFPGHQENINYGFHGIHDSPPKYEDVIKGEYSIWNNTPITAPSPPRSEPFVPKETKPARHNKCWVMLGTLVFVIVFIYFYLENNANH